MAKMQNGQYMVIGVLVLSLLASVFSLGSAAIIVGAVLALVGIVIGFTQISKAEASRFMLVALVFGGISAAAWAWLPVGTELVGTFIKAFFGNVAIAVLPAAAIVALTEWYHMGKSK
jgi:hypothetical protein